MDDYKVKTPEQVDITYTVAGIGTRFLALLLDTLIQGGVLMIVLIGILATWETFFENYYSNATDWCIAALILFVALVTYGYFLIFELLLKGRTPGKAALKLRVVRKDGRPADLPGLVLRNLIRLIDFLPVMYAVGTITMFINKDSRRLGDIVAGTVVIVEGKKATLGSILSGMPHSDTPLNNQEYAVIRDFLARRDILSPEARQQLAHEIAAPLLDRFGGLPEGQPYNPERFLETLL